MVSASLPSVASEHEARADVAPSFRAVFDAHHDFVWRALVHQGVPVSSVDDAVQEVFLVVHRRLSDYDPASPMRGWLWGIARNVALNAKRADAREGRKRTELGWSERGEGAHDSGAADRQLVLAALARLDEPLRDVLILCDVEGFSAPEVGSTLGVSPNTISSRLRLARARFAEAVTELNQEGAPRA
jgi:RNA polymerase sigma-70 factor (ECF subfamily)